MIVYATKYRLLEPISAKEGKYNHEGSKKKLRSLVTTRDAVAESNSHQNNIIWVIDESKSSELVLLREQTIKDNAIKTKREGATQADMIDALMKVATGNKTVDNSEVEELKAQLAEAKKAIKEASNPMGKVVAPVEKVVAPQSFPTDTPSEEWTVPQLREYCDNNNIKYHPASKESKLLELINEKK